MTNLFRMLFLAGTLLYSAAAAQGQMAWPTGHAVTATAGNGQITVTFPGVYGADSYNIYYDTMPGDTAKSTKKVTNPNGCYSLPCDTVTAVLDSLDNGTPYYIVATLIAGKDESLPSKEVYAIPTIPTCAYTVNFNSGNISEFTLDQITGTLKKLSGSPVGAVTRPNSMTIARDKFAYVVASQGNKLMAYTDANGMLTPFPGNPALNGEGSSWVTTDPKGKYLYIADAGGAQVSAYCITDSGNPQHIADYHSGNDPQCVTVDPKGRFLYVANYGDNTIAAYTIDAATGALTAVPNGKSPTFSAGQHPISIAIDASGTLLYVANNNGNNISAYTINQTTGALNGPTSYPAGNTPQCVTVDPSGKFLYVTNYLSNNISAYQIGDGGKLEGIDGSPFAAGQNPDYIAISPNDSNLYVTNSGENTIYSYKIDPNSGVLTKTASYGVADGVGKTPFQMVIAGKPIPRTPDVYRLSGNEFGFRRDPNAASYIAFIDSTTSVSPQHYVKIVVGIDPSGQVFKSLSSEKKSYMKIIGVNAYGTSAPSQLVLLPAAGYRY